MRIQLAAVLLLIVSSLNVFAGAAEKIRLVPQIGTHQFPFFDQPTSVWHYNGQMPGPLIRTTVGATLAVEVLNRLEKPTSVHTSMACALIMPWMAYLVSPRIPSSLETRSFTALSSSMPAHFGIIPT